MAFTFCTNCGEQIDVSLEKCPHCGHPTGAQRNYTYGMDPTAVNRQSQMGQNEPNAQNGQAPTPPQNDQNPQDFQNPQNQQPPQNNGNGWIGDQRPPENNGNPYGQNPYGQNPYGQNPYGQNQNPYGQNPYGQNPYNPYGNLYRRPTQPKRPMSTGLMVFSILNIVFGCFCFGMLFGIIGLVLCVNAQNAQSDREEVSKKKLSLAMNIIGVLLTVAYVVSYVIVFISTGGDLSMFM